ncbi:hypothetical protein [Arthrobacter sp. NyZ413]|uniref:hypothetical protein n=1 Tax=Arthrobacter sp. NyZ413 TaxID=3144669 RepID=UPI003BF7A427
MTASRALYYAAELKERLAALEESPSSEYMTLCMALKVALITLAVPILALVIGWTML